MSLVFEKTNTLIYFNVPTLKFGFNTYTKILNFDTMATDNFLTTKSVLGLAERVVMCPPRDI